MASLLQLVQSLPPDTLRRLSRIRIEPAPARAAVTMHIAGAEREAPLGVHEDGIRPIRRGPVSVTDARGMADMRPPVTLMVMSARPSIEAVIDVADLDAQIEELDRSRLVGRLLVHRSKRWIRIITSAGSQAERDQWVRCIDHDGESRPVYDEAQDAMQYVSISGNTYAYRYVIVRSAASDGGFARWHKGTSSWRAKLRPSSLDRLRRLGLQITPITVES